MDNLTTLITEAQSHDIHTRRTAFDTLVEQYRGMAYKQALLILRDNDMADDAVQEAFITAYLHIDKLREPEAFSAWLRRIVMTQCDRLIRGNIPTIVPLDARENLIAERASVESLVEAQEMQDQLQFAIDALPDHERVVTEGFYMQGQSQKEIAENLEIPVTTVKKRLQYARDHLRLLIDDLNTVVDSAIARILKPQPEPQRQPVYLYNRRKDDDVSE